MYTWARPVRGTPPNLPTRDPVGHGAKLKDDLAAIRAQDDAVKRARAAVGVPADRGMVLEFESEPGFALTLSSMDRKRVGMEVLSVREKGSITLAAVLVPDGQLAALEGLLTDYQTKLRAHRPEGERWVAPVAAIRRAVVETLWTDEGPLPPADQRIAWEVWLRRSNSAMADFRTLAVAQGIEVDDDAIEFVDRIVVLARGSLQQLTASVELLDCVAELRRAKRLASFFMGLAPRDQGPWVRDLADRTERVLPDAPVVCLLDSGVNRGHPLLEPFLSPDDLHTVDDAWGTGDHRGHGTLMAGLAAWGDLCEPLAGVER
ncbi:MAG: S8 family serine peptidase, partial [Myxococcota bacterium]